MAPVPVVHDYVGYTYALSVAAGGLMGYFTKGMKNPSIENMELRWSENMLKIDGIITWMSF